MATTPVDGAAVWTDRADNWRKADGDWLQARSILRYATPPLTLETGQVVFNLTAERLEAQGASKRYNVLASDVLAVTPGSGTTVTLGHTGASGQGIVFQDTGISFSTAISTSTGSVKLDNTGVTIKTGAATALLNTNATDLVSSIPFNAPTVRAGILTVSGATTLSGTLSAPSLSLSGGASITGALGVTGMTTLGNATVNGSLTMTAAQGTAAGSAARKDYVDAQVAGRLTQAAADTRYVLNTGDTITGTLNLTRAGEAPLIQFYNVAGGTRFGYIEGLSTSMLIASDSATGMIRNIVGGTERMRVDSGGVDITGGLTVSTTAAINGILYGTAARFGGNGGQVSLIDTAGGDNSAYMQFFGSGTTTTPGTRIGYVGYPTSTAMSIRNEISAGPINLASTGAGDINFTPGTGGDINFSPNATFNGKMTGVMFLWGKSASDIHNAGIEMYGAGSSAEGRIASTAATLNLYLHHIGAADAANMAFAQFLAGSTTVLLSEIRQNAARNGITIVNCTVSAPSDYRWKNDLGPVTGALERVMQLRPRSLEWIESGERFEGFIAHEAGDVVPYLVEGEKDAVDDNGDIEGQGFNYGGMSPLLTAALQELAERVTALEEAA